MLLLSTTSLILASGGESDFSLVVHQSDNITFTTTDIPSTINTHNTELQMVKVHINNTKHITIAECETPHYKHHHEISPRCLTQCTTGHRGQHNTDDHQTNYHSSPQLTYDMTTYYNKTDGLSPTTNKPTGHNLRKTQSPVSLRPPYPPTYTLPR